LHLSSETPVSKCAVSKCNLRRCSEVTANFIGACVIIVYRAFEVGDWITAGLYKLRIQSTHSLKGAWFQPLSI
jgi:hypothetical protein